MNKRFSGASKLLAVGLCVAAAVAMPLSASAKGWGEGGHHGGGDDDYHGGGHGGYHGGYGGYGGYRGGDYDGYRGGGYHGHGGYWSGGNWIAGALLTGAVVGLVANSFQPAPYYRPQVVYSQPSNVVYENGPQTTQIITRTTTYSQPTRYVREDDDGYYGN